MDRYILGILAVEFESAASWREEKAAKHPEHGERNLACASELSEMARRLADFGGGPNYEKIVSIYASDDEVAFMLTEVAATERSSIWFVASDPEEYFAGILDQIGVGETVSA